MFVRVVWPSWSSEGKLAAWLPAQERKGPLSNGRWRTACAYIAETHKYRRARPMYSLEDSRFFGECDLINVSHEK